MNKQEARREKERLRAAEEVSQRASSEAYRVDSERIVETIRLGKKVHYAQIHVGDHLDAVIVFGATQEEADARAAWIVERCERKE